VSKKLELKGSHRMISAPYLCQTMPFRWRRTGTNPILARDLVNDLCLQARDRARVWLVPSEVSSKRTFQEVRRITSSLPSHGSQVQSSVRDSRHYDSVKAWAFGDELIQLDLAILISTRRQPGQECWSEHSMLSWKTAKPVEGHVK
jgi:hypothetical protein